MLHKKRYAYTLESVNDKITFIRCDAANIAQEFLNEDIPALLEDLPNLILSEKKYQKEQSTVIRFRVSLRDKKRIKKKAYENGYKSISAFLRFLALKREK